MGFSSNKLPGCNFHPLILNPGIPHVHTDLPALHLACCKYPCSNTQKLSDFLVVFLHSKAEALGQVLVDPPQCRFAFG